MENVIILCGFRIGGGADNCWTQANEKPLRRLNQVAQE